MAPALVWLLLTLLSPSSLAQSDDMSEVIAQIRTLTEMVSGQKTELISKFEEIKEEVKQEVKGMINATKNDLQTVNEDLATMQRLLDLDECVDLTHNCSADATCTDTRISFRCTCKPGFQGDGYTCSDVDECEEEEDVCGPNASCINLIGGYRCDCNDGFSKTDNGTCEDIDECSGQDIRCHKYAVCENTPGNYTCSCAYFSEGDGFDCTAKDDLKCTEPFVAVRGIGCIYILEIEQEFNESRDACKGHGGDLFVAINPKHYFRLAQHFLDTYQAGSNKYMWVGVREGVWLSGRKVDPSEEAPGNPDMKSGTCSYTDGDTREGFLLWTHPCSYDWNAVCEQKVAA